MGQNVTIYIKVLVVLRYKCNTIMYISIVKHIENIHWRFFNGNPLNYCDNLKKLGYIIYILRKISIRNRLVLN